MGPKLEFSTTYRPTSSGTRLPPTCWRAGQTSETSKRCSDTRIYQRPRFIRTSCARVCGRPLTTTIRVRNPVCGMEERELTDERLHVYAREPSELGPEPGGLGSSGSGRTCQY